MLTFDLVPLHCVYEEIMPNISRHYNEMTEGDEYGEPDIDWELYLAVSRINRCVVVTARDVNKLVGYAVYTLGNKLRYKNIKQASSEGVFLEKEYRAKYSRIFLKKADEFLKQIGTQETHYILSDDRVGRILGGNGYKSKYKVWSVTYG